MSEPPAPTGTAAQVVSAGLRAEGVRVLITAGKAPQGAEALMRCYAPSGPVVAQ